MSGGRQPDTLRAQSTGGEGRGRGGWWQVRGLAGQPWVWGCLASLSYLKARVSSGPPLASPRLGGSLIPGSMSTPSPLRAPASLPQLRTPGSESSRQERPASLRRPTHTRAGRCHRPLGSQPPVARSPSLSAPKSSLVGSKPFLLPGLIPGLGSRWTQSWAFGMKGSEPDLKVSHGLCHPSRRTLSPAAKPVPRRLEMRRAAAETWGLASAHRQPET